MIKTVSTHTTGIEAHIVKCRLVHEGIPSLVAFEHHVWADWSLSVALGGVRVQVPEPYIEEARAVISDIINGRYEKELESEESVSDGNGCLTCTSTQTERVNWPWKAALLAIFLLALPIPYTTHYMRCDTCSSRWIATEQRGHPLYAIFAMLLVYCALILFAYEIWCQWCKLNCDYPWVCMP
jgi:hypothetical protein